MKQRDKINLQYKALETILKCVSAIVLCSFIGWFIVDDANNKVMYATYAAKRTAFEASWDKAVEDGKAAVEAQRAEEERLAVEEAARKAAEEAEAKRLQEEQEAKERAAQADGVAKENVVYGSKLGHVSVDGTNVSCSLYWGDSDTQFRYGAGCHAEDGCVLPGDNGTVFIGGHTGTVFSDLGSCQIGSLIHLTTSWGSFDYQITDMQVINETDIDKCRFGATEPSCILYTCYPFGILVHTTQRYAVYADLVSSTLYDASNSIA